MTVLLQFSQYLMRVELTRNLRLAIMASWSICSRYDCLIVLVFGSFYIYAVPLSFTLYKSQRLVVTDSNAAVGNIATRALGVLADGLREGFASHARALVPVLLKKFKAVEVCVGFLLKLFITILYTFCANRIEKPL